MTWMRVRPSTVPAAPIFSGPPLPTTTTTAFQGDRWLW